MMSDKNKRNNKLQTNERMFLKNVLAFGSQPSWVIAVVISGFLCLGSSLVAGRTGKRGKENRDEGKIKGMREKSI